MRIMAARTNEFATRPEPFRRGRDGVSIHRVSPLDACQTRMTTSAKLVDRFVEHKAMFSGMGIMAGYTAHSKDNAMNKRHRILLIQQVLFIFVTGDTKLERTFGPELIPVLTPMGVMAQGASSDQGPVAMLAAPHVFFANMTGDTGVVDFALAKTDPPGFNVLQVACKALLIDSRAVLPRVLVEEVFVAVGTGGLFLLANQVDGFGLLQSMAIGATLGQLAILVKKVKTFQIHWQEALNGPIREFQLPAFRVDGKAIQPPLER